MHERIGIKKVYCATVDNSNANNVALTYMIRGMSYWNDHTLLKREFMWWWTYFDSINHY